MIDKASTRPAKWTELFHYPRSLLVSWLMLRSPEPERGHQDARFLDEVDGDSPGVSAMTTQLPLKPDENA